MSWAGSGSSLNTEPWTELAQLSLHGDLSWLKYLAQFWTMSWTGSANSHTELGWLKHPCSMLSHKLNQLSLFHMVSWASPSTQFSPESWAELAQPTLHGELSRLKHSVQSWVMSWAGSLRFTWWAELAQLPCLVLRHEVSQLRVCMISWAGSQ